VSQPAADRSTWIEDRGPHPALRGIVVRSTGFAQRAPGPVRMRELPCTYVPVILDLGEGWRIRDARRPDAPAERRGSFVAGLTDGPVLVEHPGRAACLQVDLTPLGARRLLGVPMDELANRVVPLEDVLGAGGRALVDRLADAPGWEARFHLLDRALIARLGAASPAGGEVAWALGRLAAGGGVAVGDLARELGWSHRRLIARFRDEVGMAPKRVARILRFERLTALVEADPSIGWARAAAACGYFDQAHLAREVRELAGLTPTALRTERVNSVQDGAPAAA
jgi:AraC-like DNA-binding protein